DHIQVTVQDNGIGMDNATLAHVFERFYQADRSRNQVGNGLGLAIVHRGVELCGGQITVASQPGQGSQFTVVLPNTQTGEHSSA
ncbi:MAG: sensor histidine kinase, partial [Propionibacteriaceae bacterium]|nr:sensor histidine kinase [Propionibacteriaceae bacterium]